MSIFRSNLSEPPIGILVIGTLPPPPGGTQICLRILVQSLETREDIRVKVIDTAGIRGHFPAGFWRLFQVISRILKEGRGVDIITLHVASSAVSFWGIIVLFLSRLLRKPLVVRKFGGTDYLNYWGPVRGHLGHFVVRHADLYLAETKHLVQLAESRGIRHVKWFPTNRPAGEPVEFRETGQDTGWRFAYIGHVRPYKGIAEMIEAAERFDENVSVDVYGPFFDGFSEKTFERCRRVKYRGVLPPEQVIPTMRQYNATLLPTKALTEGYPGAILESFIAGVPVIVTRCGAIPEIVDDTCGLLVVPGDADALYAAMKALVDNRTLYARLREGVRKKRMDFSSEVWTERFIEYCKDAAGC